MKETRSLSAIAMEIGRDWPRHKMDYGAVPYWQAMISLGAISDTYGADSSASVVRYFLANASAWRGETARRVKAELNVMLKGR